MLLTTLARGTRGARGSSVGGARVSMLSMVSCGALAARRLLSTTTGTPTVLNCVEANGIAFFQRGEHGLYYLTHGKSVGRLLAELRAEDATIAHAAVRRADGVVVAESTPLDVLTGAPFRLELDGAEYIVEPPMGSSELQSLKKNAKFVAICNALSAISASHISLERFFEIAEDAGVARTTAREWMPELQEHGALVYLENVPNLADVVVLNAAAFAADSSSTLDPDVALHAYETRVARIDALRTSLDELDERLESLRTRAARSANTKLVGGLGVLCTQWALFFWLTFDVSDWNVMEPITYFTGTTAVVGALAWHQLRNEEYTFENLHAYFLNSKLRKLERANAFPRQRYDAERKELDTLLANPDVSVDVAAAAIEGST